MAPRAVLTVRGVEEATRQVGELALPVAVAAKELGVSWWTVMDSFVVHGTGLVDGPERVGHIRVASPSITTEDQVPRSLLQRVEPQIFCSTKLALPNRWSPSWVVLAWTTPEHLPHGMAQEGTTASLQQLLRGHHLSPSLQAFLGRQGYGLRE